jgi:tetratricopeptide (TPR) repeat protein
LLRVLFSAPFLAGFFAGTGGGAVSARACRGATLCAPSPPPAATSRRPSLGSIPWARIKAGPGGLVRAVRPRRIVRGGTMPPAQPPFARFAAPPDPGQAASIDDLIGLLRLLKVWAGDPSYKCIQDRVNAAWTEAGRPAAELAGKTTVVDCFRPGRRRLSTDMVVAVVGALHPDVGYVAHWRQALTVIGGRSRAATQVRVRDVLPVDLASFTGRDTELAALRAIVRPGGPVVITGMAGVGKTGLAVHAGHRTEAGQILFADLRGFHPDPAQPPADPAAVLEGFLRLLGVAGQQIPYGLDARAAAYRARLAGRRCLVVLDDAADEDQVRPLLGPPSSCLTLITSRRLLTALPDATHLTLDVFPAAESVAFLAGAAPTVPLGRDPAAWDRIASRCGHLPLALGLVAAHVNGKPGWTLTDHADRLDERHHDRRLDSGVELALDLSYRHLPADRQRLLRLLALHPGQDLDAHTAAALSGSDLATAGDQLGELCRDHLLQPSGPGRYALHDLVCAYAVARSGDEETPPQRRAALTRLFDHYVATAAAAMDAVYPAEAHRRPRIAPVGTLAPTLTDLPAAQAWLDAERATLVAVARHTAHYGWPGHATRLSTTLFRYLDGGHYGDASAIHGYSRHAARQSGDAAAEADALVALGTVEMQMARYRSAIDRYDEALTLARRAGHPEVEARVLVNLGFLDQVRGDFERATEHLEAGLALYRRLGDDLGSQARALSSLGIVEMSLGRHGSATDRHRSALSLFRRVGDRFGEANSLNNLGYTEMRAGLYDAAADHLQQALLAYRGLGHRSGEAWTLESLGRLDLGLGQTGPATDRFTQALRILRQIGDRDTEAAALNGLGEAATAAGRPAEALAQHTTAGAIAADIGARPQEADAQAGLGRAHRALGDPVRGRRHLRSAFALYAELGVPEADRVSAELGGG